MSGNGGTPDESPESKIIPYEDLSTSQFKMTGERFPEVTLGICDNCRWCYTAPNKRGVVEWCPVCHTKVSQIPMNIDEVCIIELDAHRGLTIRFERKLPMR